MTRSAEPEPRARGAEPEPPARAPEPDPKRRPRKKLSFREPEIVGCEKYRQMKEERPEPRAEPESIMRAPRTEADGAAEGSAPRAEGSEQREQRAPRRDSAEQDRQRKDSSDLDSSDVGEVVVVAGLASEVVSLHSRQFGSIDDLCLQDQALEVVRSVGEAFELYHDVETRFVLPGPEVPTPYYLSADSDTLSSSSDGADSVDGLLRPGGHLSRQGSLTPRPDSEQPRPDGEQFRQDSQQLRPDIQQLRPDSQQYIPDSQQLRPDGQQFKLDSQPTRQNSDPVRQTDRLVPGHGGQIRRRASDSSVRPNGRASEYTKRPSTPISYLPPEVSPPLTKRPSGSECDGQDRRHSGSKSEPRRARRQRLSRSPDRRQVSAAAAARRHLHTLPRHHQAARTLEALSPLSPLSPSSEALLGGMPDLSALELELGLEELELRPSELLVATRGASSATQRRQIQLLRERLLQQQAQTRAAQAQVGLVRHQLQAETAARLQAQLRSHQLLEHNRQLLQHVQKLVTELRQLEAGRPDLASPGASSGSLSSDPDLRHPAADPGLALLRDLERLSADPLTPDLDLDLTWGGDLTWGRDSLRRGATLRPAPARK